MTYLESVLGDFIKSILSRGINTLKSPRFSPYTLVLLIVVLLSTFSTFVNKILPKVEISDEFIDIILYIELTSALAFISVGILLGRSPIKMQIPLIIGMIIAGTLLLYSDFLPLTSDLALVAVGLLYITWIGVISFSTFSLFKDLFGNDTFGTILFLGKKEDDGKAMFSIIGWVLAALNFSLGYLLLTKTEGSDSLTFTAVVIMLFAVLAVIPLLGFQKKNDVFYSILNAFYMFTTIRVILLVFRVLTATAGETSFWDTLFSMFMALYAVQGAAVRGVRIGKRTQDLTLEESLLEDTEGLGITKTISKLLSDRGIVMVILGVLLGYHAMQVQASFGRQNLFSNVDILAGSDVVILGYEFSLIISMFIFLLSIILFRLFPKFRKFANPEVPRIQWAPDYEDLKLMLVGIKTGEVSWKKDAAKLAIGIATDKLKGRFKSKKSTSERVSGTLNKLIRRSKGEVEEE